MAQMMFGRLKGVLKRLTKPFAVAELALAQIVVAVLLLLFGTAQFDSLEPTPVHFSAHDDPAFAQISVDPSSWHETTIYEVLDIEGVVWVRWNAEILDRHRNQPLAVHTSGPFSAEFYFNGTHIGSKGEVGVDARTERAGRIDAAISIPPALIRDDHNVLALRMSSHRAGYQPATIIHNLYIGPYVADARRSLRYYAPTVLLAGVLIALGGAIWLVGRRHNDYRALWLVASIGGLLVATLAEVSRSLVNYPYDWHQPRQAVVLFGLTVFGVGLVRFVTLRWPIASGLPTWLGGIFRRHLDWVWLGLASMLGLSGLLLEQGYDGRSITMSGTLILAAICWVGWHAIRSDREALGFALALLVQPLYASFQPGDYLDRAIYALAVSLFGYALMRRRSLFLAPPPETPALEVLNVQASSETLFVPVNAIRFLKAAGNYTEVHKRDGTWVLDSRGLKLVLADLPDRFMRVHRSYAVNLEQARSVRTAAGSRYTLVMDDEVELPVGRSLVKDLRARMRPT
jgi:hypothetical protein